VIGSVASRQNQGSSCPSRVKSRCCVGIRSRFDRGSRLRPDLRVGGRPPIEAQIPAGSYRARVSGQGFVAGVGEIEGAETYRLQLWPSDDVQPALVKYWAGYDLMRPEE
jgi:hypothetical protein